MKYITTLILAVALLFPAVAVVNSNVHKLPAQTVAFAPGDLPPGIQWNRYTDTNSNFEVLALDDQKGKYLYDNLDQLKSWIMTRWAFPNESFPVKCRVIVVQTKDQFKEFFGKTSPQHRITRDGSGPAKELTIWLSTDDAHWNTGTLAKVLTEVCLQELEFKYGKVGLWVHRGMPIMNGDLAFLRQNLGNLTLISQNNLKVCWSKEILEMTPETILKQTPEATSWYDNQSACYLLMLYKEFGARKFNTFLIQCRTSNPEVALRDVYGFNTYTDADMAFKTYMQNLSNDITGRGKKITPNSYLTWPVP